MNILYIHTHDSGRIISPYGYHVTTPNIENLCNDSMLFQNAFSVAPTCSPSRAGLLTGVYPHQNGMLGLAQRGFELKKELHVVSTLKKYGYHTVLCGVQHEVGYYTDHGRGKEILGYDEDISGDNTNYEEKELIKWDEVNANNLVQWLDNNKDKKFFISFGMHATHRAFPDDIHPDEIVDYSQPPFNIPNNQITREDYAKFKTSLRTVDDNVGLVIDALKKFELYEKTIIILTTDHGVAFPFAKCTLNDSGVGVMLSVRVPGSLQKIRSYEGLISQIDVLPTLYELLDIPIPEYLEGKSFANLFKGKNYSGDDKVYSEINFHTSYEPVRSIRTKRYKYIRFFDKSYLQINKSNIDNSPVKSFYLDNGLEKQEKDEECLYDLYYDKYEKNNLVNNKSYRNILNTMRKYLYEFMLRTNDPLLDGPIEIKPEWKVNKKSALSAGSKNRDDYESVGMNWGE